MVGDDVSNLVTQHASESILVGSDLEQSRENHHLLVNVEIIITIIIAIATVVREMSTGPQEIIFAVAQLATKKRMNLSGDAQ